MIYYFRIRGDDDDESIKWTFELRGGHSNLSKKQKIIIKIKHFFV
jgi:hypothetical protein